MPMPEGCEGSHRYSRNLHNNRRRRPFAYAQGDIFRVYHLIIELGLGVGTTGYVFVYAADHYCDDAAG
jgi:hypothetical protein